MTLPGLQRAAVLHAPGRIVMETRPTPIPSPSQVLVRIRAVGICGSDMHYYREGRIGPHAPAGPFVLGHEASGVVIELGTSVTRLTRGQRVSVEPGRSCGSCENCRNGSYNLCPRMQFLAHPPTDGALLEFLAVEETLAHPVPDALSDEAAALVEPLSVALWAARLAEVTAGDHVLVTGAGPIGLLAIQAARAFGASHVSVTDIDQSRLRVAESFGATAIDVSTNPPDGLTPPANVLIECSGVQDVLANSLLSLGARARVALVGLNPEGVATVPTAVVQEKELLIRGVYRYAHIFPLAIRLIASGLIDPTRIVTDRFSLDHTDEALAASRQSGTIKPLVVVTQS